MNGAQPEEFMHIFQDKIKRGDKQQGNPCSKEYPESKADRHGDEELGLYARLQYHGHQSEKCC